MIPTPPNFTPRPWQERAFAAARDGVKTWDRIIISAATGTGKGTGIAWLGWSMRNRNKRVLIVTDRIDLVTDLAKRQFAPATIFQGKSKVWSELTVSSIQSMTPEVLKTAPPFDYILYDECHEAASPSGRRVLDHFGCKVIGNTATAFRSAPKGKTTGLGDVFQAVVFEYPIGDAIDAGDLCDVTGKRIDAKYDLSGVRMVGDDWNQRDLSKIMDTPAMNRLAVDAYMEYCRDRPSLIFCVDIEHSKHVAEMFQEYGHVNCQAAWGSMRDRSVLAAFKRGEVPAIASCDLIRQGFDAPNCSAILKLRATESLLVFTQMVGRGLRTVGIPFDLVGEERRIAVENSRKPNCRFIDFVGNGCKLTLDQMIDMSRCQLTTAKDWKKGDICQRRYDQVLGVILELEETRVYVEWKDEPPKWCSYNDIRRPQQEVLDTPELLTVEPKIKGVKQYEIFLLSGQKKEEEYSFYEYKGTWTASGISPAAVNLFTPGFSEKKDDRYTVHVCGEYELWSMVNRELPIRVGTYTEKADAVRAGQKWLKDRKVIIREKGGFATREQQREIKKLGLHRSIADMSAAEAEVLIAAREITETVLDIKQDSCSCGGLFVLTTGWKYECKKCRANPPATWKRAMFNKPYPALGTTAMDIRKKWIESRKAKYAGCPTYGRKNVKGAMQ